jgi:Divergent InlB B-repeat domain
MFKRAFVAALAATLLSIAGLTAVAGTPPPIVYYTLFIQVHYQGDIHQAGTRPDGTEFLDDCQAAYSPCQRSFEAGTVMTLTAVPVDTFTFGGWALDCAAETDDTCDLVMDQDHHVDGTFVPPDTTIPTASITKPTFPFAASKSIALEWTGDDGTGSGVASYDVGVRSLKYTDHLIPGRSLVPSMQGLTGTSATFVGKPGYTNCFYIRAYDNAGNASTFDNSWHCATIPVDDKSLKHSAGWTQKINQTGTWFLKTFSTTTKSGKTLTLANVQADQIGVLAMLCKTCGKITFKFGGKTWSASLKSSVPGLALFYTPMYNGIKTGSIVVTSASSGKTIQIDGVFAISIGNHIGQSTAAFGSSIAPRQILAAQN